MHGASAFLCPQVQQGGMSAKLLVCGSCRLYVNFMSSRIWSEVSQPKVPLRGSRSCHTCHHAMSCHAESFTEASYLLTGPVPLQRLYFSKISCTIPALCRRLTYLLLGSSTRRCPFPQCLSISLTSLHGVTSLMVAIILQMSIRWVFGFCRRGLSMSKSRL